MMMKGETREWVGVRGGGRRSIQRAHNKHEKKNNTSINKKKCLADTVRNNLQNKSKIKRENKEQEENRKKIENDLN